MAGAEGPVAVTVSQSHLSRWLKRSLPLKLLCFQSWQLSGFCDCNHLRNGHDRVRDRGHGFASESISKNSTCVNDFEVASAVGLAEEGPTDIKAGIVARSQPLHKIHKVKTWSTKQTIQQWNLHSCFAQEPALREKDSSHHTAQCITARKDLQAVDQSNQKLQRERPLPLQALACVRTVYIFLPQPVAADLHRPLVLCLLW